MFKDNFHRVHMQLQTFMSFSSISVLCVCDLYLMLILFILMITIMKIEHCCFMNNFTSVWRNLVTLIYDENPTNPCFNSISNILFFMYLCSDFVGSVTIGIDNEDFYFNINIKICLSLKTDWGSMSTHLCMLHILQVKKYYEAMNILFLVIILNDKSQTIKTIMFYMV